MMLNMKNPFLLSFVIFSCSLSLLCAQLATPQNSSVNTTTLYHVGVVLDMGSLIGKTSLSCISMAISDFYTIHNQYKTRLVLHTRDSKGDPLRALSVAIDLLENEDVQAIIGPETSDEAEFLAVLGDKAEVPIISFSATSPFISSVNTPYFIRTAPSDTSQVYSITAIVQAFRWREIVIIYEDTAYGNGVIPYLINALEEIDVRVPYRSIIAPSASNDCITAELYKLMTMQTRVFVVHMSSSLAARLFLIVKEIGMMSQGYAWIVTDGITNLLHSMDSSVIDSMQGILGIRPYIPPSKELSNFTVRWRRKFSQDNPNVDIVELNVFGIWAYDTVCALAKAVERVGAINFQTRKPDTRKNLIDLATAETGSKILKAILQSRFKCLSGDFQLIDGQMPSPTFQIVNVIGKGERVIGYWTPEHGISHKLNLPSSITYSTSVTDLEAPIWPGVSMIIPKGWVMPTSGKKLKIGVPMKQGFNELVKVERDPLTNATIVTGFCIDVFNAAVESLPYAVPYEFIPFMDANGESSGTYNDLIDQVYLQNFDAVVGDVTITANRTLYVDFTLPYTELGVGMLVKKDDENRNMWIFLKPLDLDLWLTSAAFFIFTGFVVWVIEHGINDDFQGSPAQQVGMIFWFSFSTLVFAHREKLVSNLSRFMVVVWLFVVLVLTSSYTANLTSMLTVQQLQMDKRGANIGYQGGSFVDRIVRNLNFEDPKLIPYYSVDDYAHALANGNVSAIVDEIPYIRLFLAKYHATYTMIKPNYSTNGFGFAFRRGSPLVPDLSRAVAKLREENKLDFIEKEWFKHQDSPSNPNILNLKSFRGLFLITGIASTSALIIFLAFFFYERRHVVSKFKFRNFKWERLVFVLKNSRVRLSRVHEMPTEGQPDMDVIVEPSPDTNTPSNTNH